MLITEQGPITFFMSDLRSLQIKNPEQSEGRFPVEGAIYSESS